MTGPTPPLSILSDGARAMLRRLLRHPKQQFSEDPRVIARLREGRYIDRDVDELHRLGLIMCVGVGRVAPTSAGREVEKRG